jgi:hypothetical protein
MAHLRTSRADECRDLAGVCLGFIALRESGQLATIATHGIAGERAVGSAVRVAPSYPATLYPLLCAVVAVRT